VIQVKGKKKTLKNACGLRGEAGPGDLRCPECGAPVEPPENCLSREEIFEDVEFVCPACCCGMYIEIKIDEK